MEDLRPERLVYLNALLIVFKHFPSLVFNTSSLRLILDFLTALDLSVFSQTKPYGQMIDTHLAISSEEPVFCLISGLFSPILRLFCPISPLIIHLSSANPDTLLH